MLRQGQLVKMMETKMTTTQTKLLDCVDHLQIQHLVVKAELFRDMFREASEKHARLNVDRDMKATLHARLQWRHASLFRQVVDLEKQMRFLDAGFDGVGVFPHPMVYGDDTDGIGGNTLNITACALCTQGFPYDDILVCNCKHVYHPWCAIVWFKYNLSCATKDCGLVHPDWFLSNGFAELPQGLKERAELMDCKVSRLLTLSKRTLAAREKDTDIGSSQPY